MVSNFRRLAGNITSLLTSEVVNRASTFILYALISRYLGAFEFGQLSLALSLIVIAQVLAGMGLKTLIAREVSKDREKTDLYLINGSVVVIAFSLFSISLMALFVWLMSYTPETTIIILLLSVGVIPFSLSVINKAVFRAWEQMHFIAWANVPVNIAKAGLAFLILWKGRGIMEIVLLLLASYVIILGIEWVLILRHITRPRIKIDRSFILTMLRSTAPFLGITIVVSINANIDLILLSRFIDETGIALFGAAFQLITPLIVFYETIMMSVFPEMSKRFAGGLKSLERFSWNVLELLLAIAIPAVVGLSLLAEEGLLLIYGNPDFVMSAPLLRILAWTLVLWAFTHVLGRILQASLKESVTLRIVFFSTLLKLILGLILIRQYGLIGAAVSALLTSMVDFILHARSVSRQMFKIPFHRLGWKPAMAGVCMAGWILLLRNQDFLLVAFSSCVIYVGVLLTLLIWSNGGPRQMRDKYQILWSKQRS